PSHHCLPPPTPTRRASDLAAPGSEARDAMTTGPATVTTAPASDTAAPVPLPVRSWRLLLLLPAGLCLLAGLAAGLAPLGLSLPRDRKSTRLNSSHVKISYA